MRGMIQTFARMATRFGRAVVRALRFMGAAFVLALAAPIIPLYILFRPVDVSHGMPMPRRAAGGC